MDAKKQPRGRPTMAAEEKRRGIYIKLPPEIINYLRQQEDGITRTILSAILKEMRQK